MKRVDVAQNQLFLVSGTNMHCKYGLELYKRHMIAKDSVAYARCVEIGFVEFSLVPKSFYRLRSRATTS
jgi:hypothetical protein